MSDKYAKGLIRIHAHYGKLIKVTGSSMHPTLCDGDMVKVAVKSLYEKGDILIFMRDNDVTTIAHRYLLKHKQRLLIKGDNYLWADSWVEVDNIIGVVERVYRDDAEVVLSFKKTIAILSLIEYIIVRFLEKIHYVWRVEPSQTKFHNFFLRIIRHLNKHGWKK